MSSGELSRGGKSMRIYDDICNDTKKMKNQQSLSRKKRNDPVGQTSDKVFRCVCPRNDGRREAGVACRPRANDIRESRRGLRPAHRSPFLSTSSSLLGQSGVIGNRRALDTDRRGKANTARRPSDQPSALWNTSRPLRLTQP